MLYNLTGVKRIHGGRVTLDIERLTLEKGKIYSLTGPNGAGKTTLLKILALLDKPDRGQLEFNGAPVQYNEKKLVSLRRKVVLLDQHPIMLSGSVRANVEFGLKVRGIERYERQSLAMEMLELVGMNNFAESDATDLSGGETKRVALARALVLEPQVLLCDEPTANVDLENQEIILHAIKTLNKTRKSSIVFATHYQSQAHRLADKTLFLQHGMFSQVPHDNGFRYSVLERDGTTALIGISDSFFLRVPSNLLPHEVGRSHRLFIDPEAIRLGRDTSVKGDNRNSISGVVEEMSRMGDKIRMVVDAGVRLVAVIPLQQYQDNPVELTSSTLFSISLDGIRFANGVDICEERQQRE